MTRSVLNSGMWDVRVRPASIEYVLANYPEVVLGLIRSRFTITLSPNNTPKKLVYLYDLATSYSMAMVREDYDFCQSIAAQFEPGSPFMTEPESRFLQRLQAYLKVKFAGRPAF